MSDDMREGRAWLKSFADCEMHDPDDRMSAQQLLAYISKLEYTVSILRKPKTEEGFTPAIAPIAAETSKPFKIGDRIELTSDSAPGFRGLGDIMLVIQTEPFLKIVSDGGETDDVGVFFPNSYEIKHYDEEE